MVPRQSTRRKTAPAPAGKRSVALKEVPVPGPNSSEVDAAKRVDAQRNRKRILQAAYRCSPNLASKPR